MTANRNKTNKADRSSKKIVTAVGVVIAVITLVTVFLFVKEPLFVSLASKATLNGKLDAAEKYLVVCSGEESEFLADYVALRQDINADYVNMRSNFSREKIEEWQKRVAKLSKKCNFTNAELEEQVKNLSEKLNGISRTLADYDALRPEIMGLFDISQRSAAIKDYLSMTVPYRLWENMTKGLDKSCLTTHSWKNIEKRL